MDKIENGPLGRCDIGDLYIVDSHDMGFEIYDKEDNERIAFFTQGGELALLEWLQKKYPEGRNSKLVLTGHRD